MRSNRKDRPVSTSQRRLLQELIAAQEGHLTAKELYVKAAKKDPRISLATVYRTLRLFTEQNVVRENSFGSMSCRYYEPTGRNDHHHMVCRGCGRVVEFDSVLVEQLVSEVERNCGFRVKSIDLCLDGYCRDCDDAGSTAASDVHPDTKPAGSAEAAE
ncbi:MAG: Fur family transcriptional regulator [Chloroflexota bacterium]